MKGPQHSSAPDAQPPVVPFGYFVPASPPSSQQRFTLDFVICAVKGGRWLIVSLVMLFVVLAAVAAFVMKPVYRAEIVVLPVDDQEGPRGLDSITSQFGGLAALAGLNLAGGSRKEEAIAILKSRKFTEEFIKDRDLLPVLFAGDWNEQAGKWKSFDPHEVPTLWKAQEYFDRKVRRISEDKASGVITLMIEWRDPVMAAQWANELVARLNADIRDRDISEAQRSVEYLNEQLGKTEVVELRETIHRLIETEINRVMLAKVRDEYVLRILDPAMPPDADDYVRPKRLLMILAAIMLGLALAVPLAVLRQARRDDLGRPAA